MPISKPALRSHLGTPTTPTTATGGAARAAAEAPVGGAHPKHSGSARGPELERPRELERLAGSGRRRRTRRGRSPRAEVGHRRQGCAGCSSADCAADQDVTRRPRAEVVQQTPQGRELDFSVVPIRETMTSWSPLAATASASPTSPSGATSTTIHSARERASATSSSPIASDARCPHPRAGAWRTPRDGTSGADVTR